METVNSCESWNPLQSFKSIVQSVAQWFVWHNDLVTTLYHAISDQLYSIIWTPVILLFICHCKPFMWWNFDDTWGIMYQLFVCWLWIYNPTLIRFDLVWLDSNWFIDLLAAAIQRESPKVFKHDSKFSCQVSSFKFCSLKEYVTYILN